MRMGKGSVRTVDPKKSPLSPRGRGAGGEGARLACVVATVALTLFLTDIAHSAERVDFVIGPDAPALEADAANESAAQFQKLFGVDVAVSKVIPGDTSHVVLIGSPATNPAVKEAVGNAWPKTSDQGIVIRSFERNGKPALVLGGGSPAATFWAVCEFGYQNGVRYLLHEDIFPSETKPLKLEGYEILMEPALRTRAWRTINDFAIGPEGWSAADQKKLFRQLAKMKFNRITLAVYPWQPFVDYEFKGVKKKTAQLWYGEKFRVDGDTPGKIAFGGAQYFENPDFAGKQTYEEMTAAGVKYVRTLINSAHELGMSAELSITPLIFTNEFRDILGGRNEVGGFAPSSFLPRFPSQETPQYETLAKLVQTVLRAHLKTYPAVDAIYLEVMHPMVQGVAGPTVQQIFAGMFSGKDVLSFERETLKLIAAALADKSILERSNGDPAEVKIGQIAADNIEPLASLLPEGGSVRTTVGEHSVVMKHSLELLEKAPTRNVKCILDLSLTGISAGVLPQSSLKRLGALTEGLIRNKWDGFVVQYGAPGELDPPIHYLSRASFDPQITPRQAFDDLFVTITGKQAVSDRVWKAFEHLEQASELIDENNVGFAFPHQRMSLSHDNAEPAPSWWKDVITHYTESSNELYRSHDAAAPRSRKLLFYYAKRSEYVLEYLTAVGAVRAAALAKKEGKADEATKQLETAVEQMYNALDTLSDIARDQSDRGLIAVLAEYAYRPLVKKLEEADAEQK